MGKTLKEVLSRMWIECDPNRQGSPLGSGWNADDPIVGMSDHLNGQPRWRWFEPRADATIDYLFDQGFEVVPRKEPRP
ncbi:MAG: hypothetical protein Q7T60_17000 [Sphingopyxis sp.]|nr:hypothetical protein [Sphingopyxis sp.]